MSNVWFTSDLHFGHESIVKFRNELSIFPPSFTCASDVDEWMVEAWNKTVNDRDLVWVLGDVAWSTEALKNFARLKGRKNLIMGNHDSHRINNTAFNRYFDNIYGMVKKYGVIMSHCPLHPQELEYRNWPMNLHGHIHHAERCIDSPKYMNVNIDVVGRLIPLDEVRDRLKELTNEKKANT